MQACMEESVKNNCVYIYLRRVRKDKLRDKEYHKYLELYILFSEMVFCDGLDI